MIVLCAPGMRKIPRLVAATEKLAGDLRIWINLTMLYQVLSRCAKARRNSQGTGGIICWKIQWAHTTQSNKLYQVFTFKSIFLRLHPQGYIANTALASDMFFGFMSRHINRWRPSKQFSHDPTAWLGRDDDFFDLHGSSARKNWERTRWMLTWTAMNSSGTIIWTPYFHERYWLPPNLTSMIQAYLLCQPIVFIDEWCTIIISIVFGCFSTRRRPSIATNALPRMPLMARPSICQLFVIVHKNLGLLSVSCMVKWTALPGNSRALWSEVNILVSSCQISKTSPVRRRPCAILMSIGSVAPSIWLYGICFERNSVADEARELRGWWRPCTGFGSRWLDDIMIL